MPGITIAAKPEYWNEVINRKGVESSPDLLPGEERRILLEQIRQKTLSTNWLYRLSSYLEALSPAQLFYKWTTEWLYRFSTESIRGEVRDISKEQKLTSHTVQTKEKSSRSEIHLTTRSATLFPREGTVADSSGKEECGVSPECPDRGKETLEQRLTRLIAEHDGVSPEEVTGEYIEKQRQERIYPTTRYDISSLYGGYHPKNITVYTRNEIEELKKRVTDALEKYK